MKEYSSVTGTSPSDCLVSYPRHSLGGDLPRQQRNSRCILQLQPTRQSDQGVIPLRVLSMGLIDILDESQCKKKFT